MSNESYGKYLSEVYDILNADIDYKNWADFIEKCFSKFCKVKVKHINEIACGTGTMSVELEKRGYSLTSSDLSDEMLSFADKKARNSACKNVIFTNQDMRYVTDSQKAQAVICLLDSVNCLTTPKDVKQCFMSVNRILDMGGIFLFDVNSKFKFENIYSDNAYVLQDEGVLCAWQNFYRADKNVCDFYLTFFTQQKNGLYCRHDEDLKERMYTQESLIKYLDASGFDVCGVFCDFDFTKADQNTHERLYFAAVKKEDLTES